MKDFRFTTLALLFFVSFSLFSHAQKAPIKKPAFDRDYTLEATMLGYIARDGTRNPVLRAKKGDRVRITIINGEVMTHDIAMEKMKVKSGTIVEKGTRTYILLQPNTAIPIIVRCRATGRPGWQAGL